LVISRRQCTTVLLIIHVYRACSWIICLLAGRADFGALAIAGQSTVLRPFETDSHANSTASVVVASLVSESSVLL
jgi:hypothetical protein